MPFLLHWDLGDKPDWHSQLINLIRLDQGANGRGNLKDHDSSGNDKDPVQVWELVSLVEQQLAC